MTHQMLKDYGQVCYTAGCNNYASVAPEDTTWFKNTVYNSCMQWVFT
jgi:hypothetical protein